MALYEKQGGNWIASISYESGAIIEAMPPCTTYNAGQQKDVREMADEINRLENRNWNLRQKLKKERKKR